MDHRRLSLAMGAVTQFLLSFCSFIEAFAESEQLMMEYYSTQARKRIKKRKRRVEDDEFVLAFTTVAHPAIQYNFRRFWVDARSNHWITRVLDGALLQGTQFSSYFRMNRNSFAILHGILGTFMIKV
jgi:hypothetical protein